MLNKAFTDGLVREYNDTVCIWNVHTWRIIVAFACERVADSCFFFTHISLGFKAFLREEY